MDVISRYEQLEIENRVLRDEVARLQRELSFAYTDASRIASEARQEAREVTWLLERTVMESLEHRLGVDEDC